MKKIKNKFLRFLKFIYIKLFRINDSPHRIAGGAGLGVFLGIFPGTGIIAAYLLAALLRLNKAATLAGVLATNTWLSFATFILSLKVGSYVMQRDYNDVYASWKIFIKNFRWNELFRSSVFEIILPVAAGYLIVALGIGLVVYLVTEIILTGRKK